MHSCIIHSLNSTQACAMKHLVSTHSWRRRQSLDSASWISWIWMSSDPQHAMPVSALVRSVALSTNREEWCTTHRMRGGAHCILLVHRPFIEQQSAPFHSFGISGLINVQGRESGSMESDLRDLGFSDLAEVMILEVSGLKTSCSM